MTTHTPGPWEFWNELCIGTEDEWAGGTLNVQNVTDKDLIAIVSLGWVEPRAGGTHLANAHLIAAAPDLLAACEKVVAAYDMAAGAKCDEISWADFYNSGGVNPIRAAIAKAKGE